MQGKHLTKSTTYSLVAQRWIICLQYRIHGFDPWLGKIPWRRKWQPTPVILPGKSHGQRSLEGNSPWGHIESDTAERLTITNSFLGRSPGEEIGYPLQYSWAFLLAQLVKNPPAMWETWVWFLGWKVPLEKGKATHSSILSWRIP